MANDIEADRERLASLSVLVVDDQEHVRRWIRRVLLEMGITKIVEAPDGKDALARVAAPGATYDLILCDLKMPGFDGVQLIRSMALIGIHTAVILISIESERVLETSALLAEERGLRVLGVVAKPVNAAKLLPLIKNLDEVAPRSRGEHALPPDQLRGALPEGALHLVYQPKIEMATGRLAGVEALARWRHPDIGPLQPNEFIQLCEEVPALGAWLLDYTLEDALGFAARWAEDGHPVDVAINVHAGAFDDLELPDRIEGLAKAHGVPTSRLTLEITERSVAQDAVRMLDVATRLRIKGFGLAIDDFGTGQSGLAQLHRLPFSQIKIDRQFVHGSAESGSKRSVVEASVALARNLQLTSIAEGVQRRAEWDLLQELGCEQMQGYFTARPMTEEGLQAWVAQWELNSYAPILTR